MKKIIALTILLALPIICYSVFAVELELLKPESLINCTTVYNDGSLVYDECGEEMLGVSLTDISTSTVLRDFPAINNANFSLINTMKLENSDFTGSTGITYTSTGTIAFDCSEVEGVGINCSGENITLDATGDWTGTLDGYEGAALSNWDFSTTTVDYWFDNTSGIIGNTNIVTLGTIGTGVWEGTSIADAFVDNDITASNYLALTAWYATTTDALSEGSNNLYSQWEKSGSDLYYTAGVVGVGTSTPNSNYKMNIAGDAIINGDLYFGQTAGGYTGWAWADADEMVIGTISNFPLKLLQNSNEIITIDIGQNVGISSSTPNWKLSVEGTIQGNSLILETPLADTYVSDTITASNYLALTAWYATTTDILDEGSNNLYWTNTRFDARLNATTSLSNLNILESQILDLQGYLLQSYATSTYLQLSGGTMTGNLAMGGYDITNVNDLTVTATTTFNGIGLLFPDSQGEPNQVLKTNGYGGLDWTSALTASSSQLTVSQNLWISGSGILDWGTGTTTGENGIDITTGCYAVNGSCITGGGSGSGDVGSGVTGQMPYYAANGTTLTATSTIFIDTNSEVGIGTTTPDALLVVGDYGGSTSTLEIGADAIPSCLKLQDTDGLGFTYCTVKDGTMTCSASSCNN